MNRVAAWLEANALAVPSRGESIEAAVAGGGIIAILAIGVLVGRKLGPTLAELWKTHVAHTEEGVWTRIAVIVRHAAAAILLGVLLALWPWQDLPALEIGVAFGAATALAAHQVLRGLGIPRWMSWTFAVVVFVGLLSHAIGGLEPITQALTRIGFSVGKRRFSLMALISILFTVVALWAAIRFANRVLAHSIAKAKGLDPTQKLLGQKLASICILIVAFFFGIDLLDIDLTTFAVFSGAFGLAIGFGLQKTVGNLIAGIILLMDRSIKPGDVIVIGEAVGWVNKIGVRAVSIVTRDGKEHLIPNENLMTQEVENWSYSDRNVRVRIPVAIAYDSDLRLAQDLMLRAAVESPRVLKTPKPNVWLTSYGDYAVEHEVLVWINDPESGTGNVRSDVLNRLWWMLKDNGISVPFPQRDVHIRTRSPDE